MDKYIKYKDIQECRFFQDERGEWILHTDIMKIPAADVAPVRHGQWTYFWEHMGIQLYQCSLCEGLEYGKQQYCPNCGAKMDEGQDE